VGKKTLLCQNFLLVAPKDWGILIAESVADAPRKVCIGEGSV